MYARGFLLDFFPIYANVLTEMPQMWQLMDVDGWLFVCLFGMAVTSLFVPILEFSLTESFVRMDNLVLPKRRTFF